VVGRAGIERGVTAFGQKPERMKPLRAIDKARRGYFYVTLKVILKALNGTVSQSFWTCDKAVFGACLLILPILILSKQQKRRHLQDGIT
jgi:hypothetical protein